MAMEGSACCIPVEKKALMGGELVHLHVIESLQMHFFPIITFPPFFSYA